MRFFRLLLTRPGGARPRALRRARQFTPGLSGRRHRAVLGTTVVVLGALMALFVATAFAAPAPNTIGDPSGFEASDGNMTVEGTGALDWNCLTPLGASGSTGTCGTDNGSYFHGTDPAAGTTSNISWTSGTKLDQACAPLTLSSNPGKDTFTDVSSYADADPVSHDTFLYGATIRSVANGNANENVELNQGKSGFCTEPSNVPAVLARTPGDKLITIDYPNTSGAPSLNVLTWLAAGSSSKCNVKSDTPPCWGLPAAVSSSAVTGLANAAAIPAAKNGINGSALVVNQFAEFGVDLVRAGIVAAGACEVFPQTLWESRSSSSFTSDPEDIEIETKTISTCQPATINVNKIDSSTNKPIQGAVFSLFAGSPPTGSAITTCTTDASGNCSFANLTVSSPSTAYTVEETTAPNGYLPGLNQSCTFTPSQTAQSCSLQFKDTPAPGTINIQKNDSNGHPLKGATFTLYTDSDPSTGDSTTAPDDDDTVAPAGDATSVTCTTDSTGACSFQNVTLGSYTVFEKTTPAGYETSAAQDVTIGLGSAAGTGQTVLLTFSDPYAPATINVIKQDSSTPPNPLNGAVFTLYQGNSTTGTVLGTCSSGLMQPAGDCTFGSLNISEGNTFTIAETTPPNGYSGSPPQTFTVSWTNSPQTITETFADTPVPGTINIQKNDSNGKGLQGAVFTLEQGGTPVQAGGVNVTCTTGSTGQCSFTKVALGTYSVVETTTPSGYQTAAPQTVTIGLGSSPNTGDTESLTFVDPSAPATIKVVKQDQSGKPLSGGQFELYQGSNAATGTPLAGCTTDTTGGCSFGSFTGTGTVTYTISEIVAPNGYSASKDQTFTVIYGNTPQTITETFADTPVAGTIMVQKTDDASPANPLSGAKFALYVDSEIGVTNDSATVPDADDLAVTGATCTTDTTGQCSITNVPLGTYTLFETTTPAGHQTAPAQDVTIGLGASAGIGQTVSLSFVDPRLHKVIVLVCEEGTNTLDASGVSFDGGNSTQQSLDNGAQLPTGVTEAQLCSLGGATQSDLPEGKLSPDAQITVH